MDDDCLSIALIGVAVVDGGNGKFGLLDMFVLVAINSYDGRKLLLY